MLRLRRLPRLWSRRSVARGSVAARNARRDVSTTNVREKSARRLLRRERSHNRQRQGLPLCLRGPDTRRHGLNRRVVRVVNDAGIGQARDGLQRHYFILPSFSSMEEHMRVTTIFLGACLAGVIAITPSAFAQTEQMKPANPTAGPVQGGTMVPPATTPKPMRPNPVLVRPPGGKTATPLSYTECKNLGCTGVKDDTCAATNDIGVKVRCVCPGGGGVCLNSAQ